MNVSIPLEVPHILSCNSVAEKETAFFTLCVLVNYFPYLPVHGCVLNNSVKDGVFLSRNSVGDTELFADIKLENIRQSLSQATEN